MSETPDQTPIERLFEEAASVSQPYPINYRFFPLFNRLLNERGYRCRVHWSIGFGPFTETFVTIEQKEK